MRALALLLLFVAGCAHDPLMSERSLRAPHTALQPARPEAAVYYDPSFVSGWTAETVLLVASLPVPPAARILSVRLEVYREGVEDGVAADVYRLGSGGSAGGHLGGTSSSGTGWHLLVVYPTVDLSGGLLTVLVELSPSRSGLDVRVRSIEVTYR